VFDPSNPFTYESEHLFSADTQDEWVAVEQLWYSSEGNNESWHRFDHEHNAKAAVLGTVRLDMSSLKAHEKRLPKVNGTDGRRFYRVKLLVKVQMLEGFRHELRVTARWAPDDTCSDMDVHEIEGADINVASAFKVTAV
jgi:hypothetical protein